MRRFTIGDRTFDEDMAGLQSALQDAVARKLRPYCRCREPSVAMYIARLDGQYLIKRMPLSGRDHNPACPSYEPPYELSGLGPLIGNAIQIDDASGAAVLKLDHCPLSGQPVCLLTATSGYQYQTLIIAVCPAKTERAVVAPTAAVDAA